MTTVPQRPYEFDDAQNAIFARLGGAMMFVAAAMLLLSAVVGVAAVAFARLTLTGTAILAPLGIAVAVMGTQLFAAARRFRRIVGTRGNDISNLMAALDEMAVAYGVQRWLWITVSVVIVLALATTIVGR
jgi:amino acid transporter